jgi:hypothetical protein
MNVLFLIALLAVGQAETDRAPDESATDESELTKVLRPYFVHQAANYKFSLASDAEKKLALVRKPVMAWSGGDSWFGDVFVWTHEGRPELIGCIGSWRVDDEQRGMFHEFHSLATEPLSKVGIGTRYTWESAKPGVALQEIEGAAPPARTRRLRLIQMRGLARDFSASLKSRTGMHVLRMQTPLFRYGEDCQQDGAIFPFIWTIGTDPEVLLVLESRETGNGDRWFFGAARFTWRELWLRHKEKEVWHVERYQEQHRTKTLKQPYATVSVKNVSLKELQQFDPKDTASAETLEQSSK